MACFDFFKRRNIAKEVSFRYTVQDVFSIKGRGLVVVGMVEKGSVQVGDVLPLTRPDNSFMEVIVGGLELYGQGLVQSATAGENVGIFLKSDITKDDVAKGDVLTK